MRLLLLSGFVILLFCSWGFHAHRLINRTAVFSLPAPLATFYKANLRYIEEHSVNPDKRRYVDPEEAPKHYIDIDTYHPKLISELPRRWQDAIALYPEDSLKAHGILPWQIARSYYQLVDAFKNKNSERILKLSADLGHYIADAHSPLHTTQNYNGQLSDQEGIHGFWETRLPELFSHRYNFLVGKARYIESPVDEAWKVVAHSFSLTDSVLRLEQELNQQFRDDRKYIFEQRNNSLVHTYSKDYSHAYHERLNGMVEKQMRSSMHLIASFWYSAWVDAGQPNL